MQLPSIKNNKIKLVVSLLICQGAGLIGSVFTTPAIPEWYANLEKPEFTPPSWVFAPVWTLIFLMMGLSLYLVWKKREKGKEVERSLLIFGIQLILNIGWSFLFFGLRSPLCGLLEIVLLWFTILLTILSFLKHSRVAAFLLIPYLFWVGFAAVLNFYVWQLN